MRIFIDGDNCSKIQEVVEVAKEHNVPVEIYHNTTFNLENDYATCHVVDKDKDAADFAIVNHMSKNDIVVTYDCGLAMLVLARGGYALNYHGLFYTPSNINEHINSKHLIKTRERKQGRVIKRKDPHNRHYNFKKALRTLIDRARHQQAV